MTPRERLATARLYLVCPALPRDWIAAAVRGGVDLIQLRDKTLDDDGIVAAARAFTGHDALFILNDRPDLVEACGADGVHVGQDDDVAGGGARGGGRGPDRRPLDARARPGRGRRRGRRRRLPRGRPRARDADQAGPPRRRPALRRARGERGEKPWFAIGGLDAGNVHEVLERGATRIVVVRAITEATTPRRRRGRCGTRWRVVSAPDAERGSATRRETAAAATARPADDAGERPRGDAATAVRDPRRRRGGERRGGADAAMARGYARSRARTEAIQAQLEPLGPDERPLGSSSRSGSRC